MADATPKPSKRMIGAALMLSALVFGVASVLIYAGVGPFTEDQRRLTAPLVGIVATVDFIIALVLFQQGQTS